MPCCVLHLEADVLASTADNADTCSLRQPGDGLQAALEHAHFPHIAGEPYNYAAVCLDFANNLLQLGKKLGMPLELNDGIPIANLVRLAALLQHQRSSHRCAASALKAQH